MNRKIRRALQRAERGRTTGKPARTVRISPDPVQYALSARRPIDDGQREHLQLQVHGAIEALTHGRAAEADMAHLYAAANITLMLVEQTMGHDASGRAVLADATALVKAAQEALLQVKARHTRTGPWGCAGEELGCVNALADLHDQFLAAADQRTVETAVNTALLRERQGHSAMTLEQLRGATNSGPQI